MSTSRIGSSSAGEAASKAFLSACEAATLNAISERVDGVVRAVDERDLEVDDRVAGQDALGHRLAQALLDGGNVLSGHHAADDLVAELEAGAHLGRGELDDHVPVLAVAAGLALELVVDPRRLPDRLAVGDARGGGLDRCAELALDPLDDDVDVGVAHGGEDRLAGALLATDADRGLLLAEPMQGLAELVEVGLRLRLDGDLQRRRRELDAGQRDGLRPIRDERVAGGGRGQLGDGGDVAGADLGEVLLVLALDRQERADALVLLLVDVVDVALPGLRAADHAEVGEPPDERVGGGLEHLRHERAGGVGLDLLAVGGRARADLGRRGHVLDDHVDQLADADVLRRRPDEDRHDRPLARALVQRRARSRRR